MYHSNIPLETGQNLSTTKVAPAELTARDQPELAQAYDNLNSVCDDLYSVTSALLIRLEVVSRPIEPANPSPPPPQFMSEAAQMFQSRTTALANLLSNLRDQLNRLEV